MEFLIHGVVRQGENGVFVSFEETCDELTTHAATLQPSLASLVAAKKILVDDVHVDRSEIEETGEYDLAGLFVRLDSAIREVGAKRIVLDSIETIFAGLGNTAVLRAELKRLFRWRKTKNVTAVITGESGSDRLTRHGLEEFVSDCGVRLDHRVTEEFATRRLRVVKDRGSTHGTNEYPSYDALGHLVGCVVTLTDITERRRYEAEREQLLGQVEQLVARQKEALDARDEFLSVASHELKTPLTALHLHVEGMLRYATRIVPGAIAPALRDELAAIERQGRRITSLVNDLLDVSRLRAGRMELAREAVDLSEVAREVVERIRGEAALAGCEREAVTPPGVVGCWDRNRLDQVVTNLVSNAIKYGKGKPVSLRVECDGKVARLAVEDQGIGVAPEHHERIFQRFERAVSGAEFGGMGLGLWITREILRRLDGTVRMESRLGAGARFVVELPLARAEALDPDRGGSRNPQVERSGSA